MTAELLTRTRPTVNAAHDKLQAGAVFCKSMVVLSPAQDKLTFALRRIKDTFGGGASPRVGTLFQQS